jgi:methionyl-tRNA formyltransferase
VRIVFLGSPPFATPVLERLAGSRFRPALVVTPPAQARGRGRKLAPSPLVTRARELGLEVAEPDSVRDDALLVWLRDLEADVFFVVSYGELLRAEFLALPRVAALNVHPSLLPRHRGATPIQAAILAGDRVTGVTIQKIALELDAGDVLLARELAIEPEETAGELAQRLAALASELALEALELVESGRARYVPQDPARVTLSRRLKKEDGRLDWRRPAAELERRVRALNPWPGAHTTLPSGALFFVWRAHVVERAQRVAGAAPGTVLENAGRLVVAAGEGSALELLEVQAAGKRVLGAEEFARGARLERGAVLGGA